MDIRFGDHASFHRVAVGMVGGALLAGLALHPFTHAAAVGGGLLGIGAGAAFAHGRPLLRLAAAGVAALPLIAIGAPTWLMLAGTCSVLSLGLAVGGPRGMRGLFGVLLGAMTTLVAIWCAVRIGHAKQTMLWPTWMTDPASAAAMGMVGVIAMLPRHLFISTDPVRAAMRRMPATLDSEVRGLCERSVAIWATASVQLDAADAGRNLLRDGVLKTLEVAANSADVKLVGATDDELAKRMLDLDQRIAAATDAEVRTQYTAARAGLDDQKRYRDNIRQGRERLVARMHNHVAALEKFQLAATGLVVARVASSSVDPQLEELSNEVAVSCEALAET